MPANGATPGNLGLFGAGRLSRCGSELFFTQIAGSLRGRFTALDLMVERIRHRSGRVGDLGALLHLPHEQHMRAQVKFRDHLRGKPRAALLSHIGHAGLIARTGMLREFIELGGSMEPERADQLHVGLLGQARCSEPAGLTHCGRGGVLLVQRHADLQGGRSDLRERVGYASVVLVIETRANDIHAVAERMECLLVEHKSLLSPSLLILQ